MDLIGPVLCFVGSAAVAVNFNVPRRAVAACGLLANLAWYGQLSLVDHGMSLLASNFIAALSVALFAELLARVLRLPVTCIAVPAIIPLVPGFSAYNAMYGYVTQDYDKANLILLQTVLIAGAISAAFAMAGSIVNLLPGQGPWRNPQSPIDDTVLSASAMAALATRPPEGGAQADAAGGCAE